MFCTGKVLYAGQSLGLVVARTQMQAIRAAKLVQVKYKDLQKPILTIKEALKYPERIQDQTSLSSNNLEGAHQDYFKIINLDDLFLKLAEDLASSETVIEGEFEIGGQYHFHMETHVTSCVPTEDGMDVYCSTQYQDAVQSVIADCLNMERSQ